MVRSKLNFAQRFNQQMPQKLRETNITAEVVDVAANPNDEAVAYLAQTSREELPICLLVAPESDLQPFQVSIESEDDLSSLTKGITASATRDRILETLLKAYAVMVVVEGEDAQENERAIEAAEFAIRQLQGIMAQLDKPVDTPPQLIKISAADRKRERVLLWSLGIDAAEPSKTSVAILFGRGRRLGPVLAGGEIAGTTLFDNLALVGKSCECELDRSWMQGPMFPHRWDATRQADVAAALGFDTENPLVKVEISRIIARGASNRTVLAEPDLDELDPLLGYGEISVDEMPLDEPEEESIAEATPAADVGPTAVETAEEVTAAPPPPVIDDVNVTEETNGETELDTIAFIMGLTMAGIAFVALGVGVWLLSRNRGQA